MVMQEHDIQGPDFWKACETVSGQFRAIGEKQYLRYRCLTNRRHHADEKRNYVCLKATKVTMGRCRR